MIDFKLEFDNLKRSLLECIFCKMNEEQRKAIFHVNGPLLILAGAGSGKTTVIVNRISFLTEYGDCYYNSNINTQISQYELNLLSKIDKNNISIQDIENIKKLICNNPIKPFNILAITFTNKAANELKERLLNLLGEKANDLNTGTFHSICVRILRRNIDKLGYQNNFTIYDTDDSIRVLKECFTELNINEKMFPYKSVLNEIGRAKDKLISYKEYQADSTEDYRKEIFGKIYEKYQKKLENANALDFDDIISLTVKLFLKFEDVLDYYQNRYRYILVDEYQDTNHAQYKLISLLSAKSENLCVVGDDDQSIYAFRGATIDNILNFESQFKNCLVIRLEQNYRSTQTILDAANNLIKNNSGRKGKNLWTDVEGGELIDLYKCEDEQFEAEYVTKKIVENVKAGKKYSDHVILYRMNAQSANMERFFVKSAIPYKVIGGTKFFERKEIKDIISYLAVINNHSDNIRLKRIINEPKRGIGNTTVELIQNISDRDNISLYDVIYNFNNYKELSKKSNVLINFLNIMEEFKSKLEIISLNELIDIVYEKTGYMEYLVSQGKEGINRIENINELKSIILKYSEENEIPTLSGFLEEVSLYTDLNNLNQSDDNVIMMTVHSAKGLEFDTVFIVGLEEGIFPSFQSTSSEVALEEERRLAYVAITRAKRKLHITNVKLRMLFGNTSRNLSSRFVKEIPKELVALEDVTIPISAIKPINKANNKITMVDKPIIKMASEHLIRDKINVNYSVGDSVMHGVFGKGMIARMTNMSNDVLIEVVFEKIGTKKIMANFAKLEKI